MEVSLIITTRNEEANLENCLVSITNQTFSRGNIEIIVVDNNSRDRTKEIARRYTTKVYNYGPERSAQRNHGVSRAQGTYVLYLDADMILSEPLVEECVQLCARSGCVALFVPEKIRGKGFWAKARDFERSFYDATCIDCVRFVRRDIFLSSGGFDETLTGPEDWDFDRRIRALGSVGIVQAPLYHNEGAFNLKSYLNKKKYYAAHFDKYMQKWGRNDRTIKKQLGFFYRYVGIFFENGKWRKLVRHPGLAGGMYFLRILVGVTFLSRKR